MIRMTFEGRLAVNSRGGGRHIEQETRGWMRLRTSLENLEQIMIDNQVQVQEETKHVRISHMYHKMYIGRCHTI